MNKILIIEDDKILLSGLEKAFKNEQYHVLTAEDGEEGLYLAKTESPDLIILDIMMPYMNGFEVTTEIRRIGDSVPIIILSARVNIDDKIRGLDLGADDYITKPFDIKELMARIRRKLNSNTKKKEEFGDFIYDWRIQKLTNKENKSIGLNNKERKLLEFFLKRKDRIVTREMIIDAVWGDDYDGTDRTVDNYVVNLRKKIGTKRLETVRGEGYRFVIKL